MLSTCDHGYQYWCTIIGETTIITHYGGFHFLADQPYQGILALDNATLGIQYHSQTTEPTSTKQEDYCCVKYGKQRQLYNGVQRPPGMVWIYDFYGNFKHLHTTTITLLAFMLLTNKNRVKQVHLNISSMKCKFDRPKVYTFLILLSSL